ncbi:MAG: MobA/MobL family protein [Sphingomonadaceae bacterium]|nr:MobA/MobL family protein [Sphingomonadaceae bacterium]
MAATKKKHPLFHDGSGKVPGVTYGVLRAQFRGKANSAAAYVAGKLAVSDPSNGEWAIGNRRSEIIIPSGAPSLWWSQQALWSAYEAARLSQQRDLLIALTAYADDNLPLHEGWEQARAWARSALVIERSLAATLVLHVPTAVGSSNTPHVHILSTARQVLGWGFGPFATETNDEGARQLALDLKEHRQAWARGERR